MRIMFLSYSPRGKSRDRYDNETQRQLESYASPGTEIVLTYPEDLGGGVIDKKLSEEVAINGLHHILRVPALIKKIIEAEREGFDAVIQSNTYDPGVEEARLAVRIPVVGLLRSTCHVAACLAQRVGITILVEAMMPYTRKILRDYGLGPLITGIKALGMYEAGDLDKVREPIKKKVIELAKELKAEGAEVVIPLGGRVFPGVITCEEIEAEAGIPILNTKAIGIQFAEMLVRCRMSHSPIAYPCRIQFSPEDVTKRM
ncbi:MAG TPA: aspartate/glutamate racemase family protein [Candidatus Binatia bacterium]|nr:aspartate/glutamate racemase family protein [Candidatus Binatia bacterium]